MHGKAWESVVASHEYEGTSSPYISCSSIGSISLSSSSERSESKECGENGSGKYADAGTVLANRPLGVFDKD